MTPGIWAICRSSGCATEEAMVSGEAPGRRGADRDGREVDLRQRRDRQQRIGDDADQQDRHHQQRRRDGMADEGAGDAFLIDRPIRRRQLPPPAPASMATRAPGCKPNWPTVTTFSPSLSPLATTATFGVLVREGHRPRDRAISTPTT